MYVDYRQNNWSEWLATAKFAFNNKIHTATKLLPFKVNYEREPRIGFDIRKKRKYVKVEEFVKEIKDRYKKAKVVLVKSQKEMKKYVDRNRKEAEEYRIENKVLMNMKDFPMELMKKVTKKLMEKYIGSYVVKKIISENVIELELLVLLRIYLVVNLRRIVKYQEQIEGQKKIVPPLVEIEGKKEYEVEKILNRKERKGKPKYLVRCKGYMAEKDTWEELEDLKNIIDLLKEFEKKIKEEEI